MVFNLWVLTFLLLLQDDFSNIDSSINGPKAFFANMPLSKTLTMNLDVPEPWLVEPILTVYVLCICIISLTFVGYEAVYEPPHYQP